jgi:hypothetical protein
MDFMKSRTLAFVFLLFFARSAGALAQTPTAADVSALRAQIDALKADYEKRIQELETQLQEIQTQLLQVAPEGAPAPAAPPTIPTSPGALNPAISVIGNFVGRIDDKKVFNDQGQLVNNTLGLREAEVDMRVPVDPYADGVLILALESDFPGQFTTDVEEGYVNVKKLPFMQSPLGMKWQVGRFRPAFGTFNTLHLHDLPTTQRSLVTKEFLGEDGFISQGVSTDFFLPTWDDNSSLNARVQVLTGGDIAVAPESGNRLAYLGNLRWFKTFGGSNNVDVAWSTYLHPGRSNQIPMTRLQGLDFMYRWKPFRQGEWKSYILAGQWVFTDPVNTPRGTRQRPYGATMFTQWQFDRRKYAGARWDYATTLADPNTLQRSLTPYLSYYFSEFLRFRVNYEHLWSDLVPGGKRNSVFLELNWIFGSHPPEPFWVNK